MAYGKLNNFYIYDYYFFIENSRKRMEYVVK